MTRINLDKNSRKLLFENLKKGNKCSTYQGLAKNLRMSYKGLQKWIYGPNYIPKRVIPKFLLNELKVIDEQKDNWGPKKGGNKAIKVLKKKYKNNLKKWHVIGGNAAIKKLRDWINKNPKEFKRRLIEGKYQRTKNLMEQQKRLYNNYFRNHKIIFNHSDIEYSKNDIKKGIKIPRELTPKLAEEIGIHCGDGTLPNKKYYFSVRGDIKEEEYYSKFILKLYKDLFNINSKLIKRGSVHGIEFSSKVIYLFKNKVLNLPIGEKVNRIDVPSCIMNCKDKKIIQPFIRGVFDTDGCISFRTNRDYPFISILIKSKKFMYNLNTLLKKLGFIPRFYNNNNIIINGPIQLKKWYEEIGSSNPKHLNKIKNYFNRAPVV